MTNAPRDAWRDPSSRPVATIPTRTVAVILHYAREEMTAACVAALERSTEPVRVVIVDNASPDGSGERVRARFPQHDFLPIAHNLGYAGGNNRGIEWALAQGAERVLVINDDAEAAPDCVAQLNAALDADAQAGAAAPTMVHGGGEPSGGSVVWWGGGRFDRLRVLGTHEGAGRTLTRHLSEVGMSAQRATALCGCAILFRAEALRQAGTFREDFGSYVEDLELSVRFTRAGWRLLYVPSALLVHKVSHPEPEAAAWKIRLRDRNRRRLARRHLGVGGRLLFLGWFLPTRLALFARYLLRGDWARARAIVAGLLDR